MALFGWFMCLIPLGWLSIFVFFITVPTWSDALFSKKWYHKIAGIFLWAVLLYLWFTWGSFIEVKV